MTVPPRHPVDVFLLLVDDRDILLALRQNTGYADGLWNLPSGKLEFGEDARTGVIREAREEVGIRLRPERVRLAATVHHLASPTHARLGLVFAANFAPAEHGEPANTEPHKCGGIDWFPATALPSNMSHYSADCIQAYLDGAPFRLSGWPPPTG